MALQKELPQKYEDDGIDPFSAPPAGYSLTKLMQSEERFDLIRLMDAGIPIETLVRTVTFSAFTKGIINPDVSELLLVPLSLHLLTEARRAGITPKFNNNVKLDLIPQADIFDLMSELNPKRYKEYLDGTAFPEDKEEDVAEKNQDPSFMGIKGEQDNGN